MDYCRTRARYPIGCQCLGVSKLSNKQYCDRNKNKPLRHEINYGNNVLDCEHMIRDILADCEQDFDKKTKIVSNGE